MRFAEQALKIQATRVHGPLAAAVTRPHFMQPIAKELVAVVVGITPINRFTYAVIGCAFKRMRAASTQRGRRARVG